MNDPSVWFKMAAHLATTVSDTLAKVLPLFQTNSVSEAVKHEAQGLLRLHSWRQIKQEVNQCRGGFITSGDLSKRITGVLFSKKKTYFSILKNDFSI